MNAAVGLTAGLGLDGDRCIRVIPRQSSVTIFTLTLGDGKVVQGRRYTDRNQDYASVEIDELVFFNGNIDMVQIQMLAA